MDITTEGRIKRFIRVHIWAVAIVTVIAICAFHVGSGCHRSNQIDVLSEAINKTHSTVSDVHEKVDKFINK